MKPRPAETGFTLTELLIVVAVAGILAAIAVPSFQSLTQSQQVKNASFELFSSLSLARSEAIKRNGSVTVTPAAGGWQAGWTIASGGTTVATHGALKGVAVSGGPASVTYARSGRANASASFQLDVSPANTEIRRCISIDLSGMPRTLKGACS